MAVMPKEQTIKLRLDTSQFLDQIDHLDDEALDRLAERLAPRVERALLRLARMRGER